MQKTINEYPQSTGTKQDVLKWWKEYTRNLTASEVVERSYGYSWEPNIPPLNDYGIKQVDSTGGDEGEGEYMDMTFQIVNVSDSSDVLGYVQLQGTYNSWDASEWHDEPYVVNPTEVTKVEFI